MHLGRAAVLSTKAAAAMQALLDDGIGRLDKLDAQCRYIANCTAVAVGVAVVVALVVVVVVVMAVWWSR
jgi:hypothetical protein